MARGVDRGSVDDFSEFQLLKIIVAQGGISTPPIDFQLFESGKKCSLIFRFWIAV